MLWVTTIALAVLVVALLAYGWTTQRSRPDERRARTAELLLSLPADTGHSRLEQERERSDVWWTDAHPLTRRKIDRTLSTWDLVASLARSGRIDQRVVVEHFGSQVVDLWELAYPYVQHRHEQQPRLWGSLAELYLDAFEGRPAAPALPPAPKAEPPAPPEPAPVDETAAVAEPPPVPEPAEPVETHQLLIAALRDIPPPAPPAPRSPAPPAPRRQPQPMSFEEVVDLVPQPPTRRD